MSETHEVYEANQRVLQEKQMNYEENQRALRESQEKMMNAAKTYVGNPERLENAVGKIPRRVTRPHYKEILADERKALRVVSFAMWWAFIALAVSLAGNIWLLITR
jgi:hypothetical protein